MTTAFRALEAEGRCHFTRILPIRQVLNWLLDVDLIEQHTDKIYTYQDPVLQMWMAYYYSGLQLSGMPSQKVLNALVAELIEKYERAANELGLALVKLVKT